MRWVFGELLIPALPETIMTTVNGMEESPPLRSILTHPALDRLDLCIYGMEIARPHVHLTKIALDNDPAPLSRSDLNAIWDEFGPTGVIRFPGIS